MLDRLIELACSLAITKDERPSWLLSSIKAMAIWAKAVRLEGGFGPRLNDSAQDAAPPLDEVIAFADGLLPRSLITQVCVVSYCWDWPHIQALQPLLHVLQLQLHGL